MKRLIVICLVCVAVFGFSARAKANLIVNGDFESGDTGFFSDYTDNSSFISGGLLAEGTYVVTTNPSLQHPSATSYGDKTTGSGNMLALNGATTDSNVWSQTVPVSTGQLYELSFWLSSWYSDAIATFAAIDVKINGVTITGSPISAPSTAGVWDPCSVIWNSGASSSALIELIDTNKESWANDFALDDISLEAVPEPATICLLGLGVLSLIRRKR